MKFPNEYSVLDTNIFENGRYKLVPIRYEDRFKIMEWRNEQMYHLRQKSTLTKEDQETYFTKVVSNLFKAPKPDQLLFSYLEDGNCIGYGGLVHINWESRNAEVSFIMDTNLEKDYFEYHWSTYLSFIEQIAFSELRLHKIFVYAFDLRPHLYEVLEKQQYTRDARLPDHVIFQGEYKDVVIHSKISSK